MQTLVNPPLIITLKTDDISHAFFSEQRRLYFPSHANFVDAHITLFHKLPAEEIIIQDTLDLLSHRDCFEMNVTEIINTGKGIAYSIDSPPLADVHHQMQLAFAPLLIRKDRQKLRSHITVQNKVTAYKAQCLYAKLKGSFKPFTIQATGFSTWFYLKGPWEKKADFCFRKNP